MTTPRRLRTAIAALLVAGAITAPAAGAAAPAHARVPARQELVALIGRHTVRERPRATGRMVTSLGAQSPITGAVRVLPVLARTSDAEGHAWVNVRLPGRMNGGAALPPTGWILAAHTRATDTPWYLVVDTGARQLSVYRGGRLVRSFRSIVGATTTPTPLGSFFVEENVQMPAGSTGAPFALATSARSAVLHEFAGGPGQIAIHGLVGVGGQLGTAVSHGCVRVANDAVTWLAARLGPGVPITIR